MSAPHPEISEQDYRKLLSKALTRVSRAIETNYIILMND